MPILKGLVALLGALAGLVALVLSTGGAVTLLVTLRLADRFPPKGPFVDVTGGRLATLVDGPEAATRGTVVLLHGASANAADPMESVGRLLASQGFRVVAFDRPGYGWSDRLGGDMATPAAQGRAIAEALDRLGIGRAILLGHSWSGALATALALDHPERVAGLVLVAPVAMPFPAEGGARREFPWFYRLALTPPVAWLLSRTVAAPLGLYYLHRAGEAVFRPQEAPGDYLERSRAALVLRPATMLANLRDLVGLPAAIAAQAPRYGTIIAPTVVVAGDADAVVPAGRQAVPLAAAIPGARLVMLPGIGHMVPWVAAEALAAEVGHLADRIAADRREAVAP